VTVIVYLGIVVVMIGTDKEELVDVDEVVESEFVFDEEELVVIIEEDAVLVWDCD
jgi:5,10-methenyltetrahydromethanopterin hydrogenase